MITTLVYVNVKSEYIDDFIKASCANHEASIKEAGNLRFDVLQKADNPSEFVLYEAYENETLAAAHKETEHYKKWRETVADWMAKPREGLRYNGLKP